MQSDGQGDGQMVVPEATEAAGALQSALRAHLAQGALPQAQVIAARLAGPGRTGDALGLVVDAALEMGQVQQARLALAEGEGRIPPQTAALLRARIARAQGDLAAARAILVAAIEAMPDDPVPRRVLAEVMVATGTAADARAVLAHLGARPGANPTE